MSQSPLKTGRLSNDEVELIRELASKFNAETIAKHLNRRVEAVRDFLKRDRPRHDELESLLISRSYWKEITQQFSKDELEQFILHWSEMFDQFNRDVTWTEELQMIDVIRFEILITRNLKERQEAIHTVRELEVELEEAQAIFDNSDNDKHLKAKVWALKTQILDIKNSQRARNDEHVKLHAKKADLFKELKGTREQRVQVLNDSRTTFISLLKALDEKKEKDRIGTEMELMRQAAVKEKQRLAKKHTYDDGMIDLPILTADTITQMEENEGE